jgi:hypothetical protein
VAPALPPGTLNDVNVINPDATAGALPEAWFADFLDTPQSHPFHDFIERLFRKRVTAGCGSGNYCPESSVTRGQMAVFILKAKNGPGYQPPPATGLFGDVPVAHIFARWIEQLSREGITAGCGGGNYCPDDPVTRGQMAVFLLKALFGSDFLPAPATGLFTDVPVSNPFARWIELLFAQKITSGCGAGLYCPAAANTRGQMAVFLSRTFLGVPTVTVNSPPAIARDHLAAGADFGPKPTLLGVTAGMSIAFDTAADFTDACQALTPASAAAAAGKLLLVRRGACPFVTQVKNGQNAGAVGVIVMETVFGRLPGWMPGSDPTITIPAVQVSRESGDAFIANSATINATLGVKLSAGGARAAEAFALPDEARRRGPVVVLPPLRENPRAQLAPRPPGQ